jgi:hypothetical protein
MSGKGFVTPWPQPLARSREWHGNAWRRSGPSERYGDYETFVRPTEEDLAQAPRLMVNAVLAFPRPDALPAPPSGPDDGPRGDSSRSRAPDNRNARVFDSSNDQLNPSQSVSIGATTAFAGSR